MEKQIPVWRKRLRDNKFSQDLDGSDMEVILAKDFRFN
tara:strand:- start:109 stop:222 length:114 start_codon:yes stop_codon:yes gene_type:complete